MSDETIPKTVLPTVEEAKSLMPEGRQPYVNARIALGIDPMERRVARHVAVVHAIKSLAIAERAGEIAPPLTPELSQAVDAAETVILADGKLGEFDQTIGTLILEAVFEHGYSRYE